MTYQQQYAISRGTKLSTNFLESEFLCTCRGQHCSGLPGGGIDPKAVVLLETIRELVGGRPITIISGYRCTGRNNAVGGATSSQHLLGTAADFIVSGMKPWRVRMKVRKAFRKLRRSKSSFGLNLIKPFKGIGFGLGKYKGFTHVDTRRNKARWTG